MRRKIPSSAALLAFEAAARHGNFARAAAGARVNGRGHQPADRPSGSAPRQQTI
ncbi:hypothetical protein LNO19_20355 [Klebsiella quasipneumoniae subsp. similipneumoniae]|nr:hypothetical protein [Klebsiella quasipneumoniae subsp. similipneumoniae]